MNKAQDFKDNISARFPLGMVRLALADAGHDGWYPSRPRNTGKSPAVVYRPLSSEAARTTHCGQRPLVATITLTWIATFTFSRWCFVDDLGEMVFPG